MSEKKKDDPEDESVTALAVSALGVVVQDLGERVEVLSGQLVELSQHVEDLAAAVDAPVDAPELEDAPEVERAPPRESEEARDARRSANRAPSDE